jgi:ubiquinone/menaquinone biosynthesis C-methylase UbiE
MTQQAFDRNYGGSAPENYERYFVPSISAPLAEALIRSADLHPGQRVLDVACGTGTVAKLAAGQVGGSGRVAGLDVNPGMLAVARATAPPQLGIDWYETSAEAIPLADGAFDVALCQLGLQFIPDKPRALREVRRVLAPGGRIVLNVPGPTPPLFAALADSLGRHIEPRAAAFVDVVFSLHDEQQLRELVGSAGFHDVDVQTARTTLALPPARDFLWQYVCSTPLASVAANASDEGRAALENDVDDKWREFAVDGMLACDVDVLTVIGR